MAGDINAEARHIRRRIDCLMPGESVVFDEKYIHQIFGNPLTEAEAAHQISAKRLAIKALADGDRNTASEFADAYFEDPTIYRDTSIKDWLEAIWLDWEINKPNMSIKITRPKNFIAPREAIIHDAERRMVEGDLAEFTFLKRLPVKR